LALNKSERSGHGRFWTCDDAESFVLYVFDIFPG
jgi:hypothetical protein